MFSDIAITIVNRAIANGNNIDERNVSQSHTVLSLRSSSIFLFADACFISILICSSA